MRKIEALMIAAVQTFADGRRTTKNRWRSGNTEVIDHVTGIRGTAGYLHTIDVELHGNLIATIYPDSQNMYLMDAGWKTVTTKSRLNALCKAFTACSGIYLKKGEWQIECLRDGTPTEKWSGRASVAFTIDWNRCALISARAIKQLESLKASL